MTVVPDLSHFRGRRCYRNDAMGGRGRKQRGEDPLHAVFFFQAEDGIRDWSVTGVQTCALPISRSNVSPLLPESNDAIPSTTGKCPSVGSKGDTLDLGGKPVRPEQSAALQVPQFDGSIPAPSCKRCAIQTESQGSYGVGMRLPGLVQDLPSLHPDLHIPPPATCCPGLTVASSRPCSMRRTRRPCSISLAASARSCPVAYSSTTDCKVKLPGCCPRSIRLRWCSASMASST